MSLAIRAEDRALALVRRGNAVLWHPEPLIAATFKVWRGCIDAEAERLRLRFHNGPVADSISARAQSWARRDIAINDGPGGNWRDWDNTVVCPLLTHEIRHPTEIRYWKPAGTFQAHYVFRVRFRWAAEMQGDIAVMRWNRKMKMLRANALRWAESRAASYARRFPGYNMGRIKNLRGETVSLLMAVFDGKLP